MSETIKTAKKGNWWTRLDASFSAKHPEIWKIIKFFIMGGISNVPELGTQLCAVYVLRALNVTFLPNFFFFNFMADHATPREGFSLASVVYAYMISTAVGYTVAFILNRKATFHADSNVALSTFLYILMVIFTIAANGVIGPAIEGAVGKLTFLSVVLVQVISKLLAMIVPGLWTYPLNRFVIHRHKTPKA
ncbi:MAG: GtrA family protein [Oscillospiraceae bacterium]|jgi:putative flippase GtrA|nr:GtrA family protein [Oscillospiraceae bacterium]